LRGLSLINIALAGCNKEQAYNEQNSTMQQGQDEPALFLYR